MPQRYFIETLDHKTIQGQDAHHIKKVMRMNIGDDIIVCQKGHCFLSQITSLDNDVTFEIISQLPTHQRTQVTIIQGLPKHPKSEFITKYATMFGAHAIYFVEMDRSISKLENKDHKIQRLSLIAKEAGELSHLFSIPTINMCHKLRDINFESFDHIFLADEEETQHLLVNQNLKALESKHVAVIIGPEGGISKEERMELKRHKAIPISLGKNILPTEAACLFVLSHLAKEIH